MSCKRWLDRREFLGHTVDGLKGIALAVLLHERELLAKGQPHFPPAAKKQPHATMPAQTGSAATPRAM